MTILDKYAPTDVSEVYAVDRKTRSYIMTWANGWKIGNIPEKRALLFTGPAGIGKTAGARAVAEHFGFAPIEINASKDRTEELFIGKFENYVKTVGYEMEPLFIVDEVDNIGSREGSAVRKYIRKLVRTIDVPIIFTANDDYKARKYLESVMSKISHMKFDNPKESDIRKIVKKISDGENLGLTGLEIIRIARMSQGDIRNIGKLMYLDMSISQYVEASKPPSIFALLGSIFSNLDIGEIHSAMLTTGNTPKKMYPWLVENVTVYTRSRRKIAELYIGLARCGIYVDSFKMPGKYSAYLMLATMRANINMDPRFFRFRVPADFQIWKQRSVSRKQIEHLEEIFGMPSETRASFMQTLPFIRAMVGYDIDFRFRVVSVIYQYVLKQDLVTKMQKKMFCDLSSFLFYSTKSKSDAFEDTWDMFRKNQRANAIVSVDRIDAEIDEELREGKPAKKKRGKKRKKKKAEELAESFEKPADAKEESVENLLTIDLSELD